MYTFTLSFTDGQVSHIKSVSFIEKQAKNRKNNGSYVNFTQKTFGGLKESGYLCGVKFTKE